MKTYSKRRSKIQIRPDLPSFNWRLVVPRRPNTTAGSFISRRYRVHPAIADLIAEFAGLGEKGAGR